LDFSIILHDYMKKECYGTETAKALKNFPFSGPKVSIEWIHAIVQVKHVATVANSKSGRIDADVAGAIVSACSEIMAGKHNEQFCLPALQGGAGTSINANINEVIASRASEILKNKITVRPNDEVNASQSTNDVLPSALKIVCIRLVIKLLATLDVMAKEFEKKSKEFKNIHKLGRTHLQDAVPTTLGAEFASYAVIIRRHNKKIGGVLPYLYELNLGGTAIGNSINASPRYIREVYHELQKITKLPLKPAENLMSQTSSQADFVMLSQAVAALMIDMSKIASDLRLLASGPNGGLNEIIMPELQNGSSIMPGKVNPILPEAVNQLYFLVSGNNLRIELAAQAAQLELGVMGPSIADALINSLKLSHEVLLKFAQDCVGKIKANEKACKNNLESSTAFATLLTPEQGYDKVAEEIKRGRTKF